ncbi:MULTISPECIES: alpha/beta hydrolase [Allobranchiibius]|uniref:Dienelactone hydrolase n=1 Tax=Allobranchiibius huperziae TaxID=1874116 RepID=A0A853DF47_9MICO|nr:alpha/beta fold hydrolase [Allobranchiibius sp. GilTou73]NYJ76176.1 dienelactone hydrolase [Allobranchiibius huperziae]UIJ35729.1 alpha/beta fold hydrolase [Allobranchiibius sp. GilTou73]
MPQPRLIETAAPQDPAGLVLVLHGGAARRGEVAVSPTQLSVVRMIPIAARVARESSGRLAVFRLLNSSRGWDTQHTPVQDVQWALEQLRQRFGEQLPICLIGHSLGGRAALLSADANGVRSIVALAPWVYPNDAHGLDASGRQILFVHGSRDRVAKPSSSAAVAATMAGTAEVGYVTITGGKHAMLRHGSEFERLAADFTLATLLGTSPSGTVGRVLAGETAIRI